MNEQYITIIQGFIAYWGLNRKTATLIATAILSVARHRDKDDRIKTNGILMAYNAANLIDENTMHEGYALLDKIVQTKAECEAIDAIYKYFDECDLGRETVCGED